MRQQPATDVDLNSLDDEELVVLVQQRGCRPAEEELLLRYWPWTKALIRRLAAKTDLTEHDLDDASQDAVFGVMKAIAKYDTGQLAKSKGCPFRFFLQRVITNRFRNLVKRHWRNKARFGRSLQFTDRLDAAERTRPHLIARSTSDCVNGNQDPASIAGRHELNARLVKFVNRLEPRIRSFLLELISGSSLRVAGEKVGISYEKAKRTRRRLHSQIERCLDLSSRS